MPLLNKNLTDDLGKIFKYPISINQSIKGFFSEMDTYGKMNQKTLQEIVIMLVQYVNELNKVSLPDQTLLYKQLEDVNQKIDHLEKQVESLKNKPGRPPNSTK
jgi:hypothetical protein